jgi:hypothetical protein
MITPVTAFIVTLNASTLSSFSAIMAMKIESFLIKDSSYIRSKIVSIVNVWVPVHTDHVGPQARLRIQTLHDAVHFIT